jgi:hypothetical protein
MLSELADVPQYRPEFHHKKIDWDTGTIAGGTLSELRELDGNLIWREIITHTDTQTLKLEGRNGCLRL